MKTQSVTETKRDAGSSYIQWHNDWQYVYSVMVGTSNKCFVNFKLEIGLNF